MPRDSLQQFDPNPALDTDIAGISTAPGWSPANVGPAFRALMSRLASFSIPEVVTVNGAVTLAPQQGSATLLQFVGTGGTVSLPALRSWGWAQNVTTGNIVLTGGVGSTLTIASGLTVFWIWDQLNVYSPTLSASLGTVASLSVTGAVTSGSVVTGAVTASGAGTFASVFSSAGVASSGGVIATTVPGSGNVQMAPGGGANTGYVAFYTPANVRAGYIGYGAGGTLNIVADPGFSGWTVSGNLAVNGVLTHNGVEVCSNDGRTYAINITGNAGTATHASTADFASTATLAGSAQGAPWGGISGIPSQVSTLNQTVNTNSDVTFANATVSGIIYSQGATTLTSTGMVLAPDRVGAAPESWTLGIGIVCNNAIAADYHVTFSDGRFKDDVRDLTEDDAVDWVMRGRARRYIMNGTPTVGFIAQEELASGRSEVVSQLPDGDPLVAEGDGYASPGHRLIRDYQADIPFLTMALQQALKRIAELERLVAHAVR